MEATTRTFTAQELNEHEQFVQMFRAAKQLVSSPGMNISTVALGRAFKQLGFRPATVGHSRGYYVVRITPEERKQRAVSMGYDAWKQQVSAASKDTDVTDVTDVS